MTAIFARDMASYLAAAKLAQHTVALHRLGCDQAILSALRAAGLDLPAISTRPVLFIIHEALKVPGGYHMSPPHQDWRSMQGGSTAIVWIPFAEVGRRRSRAGGAARQSSWAVCSPPARTPSVTAWIETLPATALFPLELELGDAVMFSSFLVHRTGRAGEPRMAASYRYNNVLEPSFIERGYPNRASCPP